MCEDQSGGGGGRSAHNGQKGSTQTTKGAKGTKEEGMNTMECTESEERSVIRYRHPSRIMPSIPLDSHLNTYIYTIRYGIHDVRVV
jgi:hypothetical protein